MTGTIYFIACKGTNAVKIGFTKDAGVAAVNARVKILQTGSPGLLYLIFCAPGTQSEESALHRRFQEYRIHGEWFQFGGLLKAFISDFALENGSRYVPRQKFEARIYKHCGYLDRFNFSRAVSLTFA